MEAQILRPNEIIHHSVALFFFIYLGTIMVLRHMHLYPFLLSYFFVKKYLLVGASGMLWTGQWVSE